jgi:hypothetical protein
MSNLQMRKKFDMIKWHLNYIIILDYFQSQNIQFLKLLEKKKNFFSISNKNLKKYFSKFI